jgi:hypothetical protein
MKRLPLGILDGSLVLEAERLAGLIVARYRRLLPPGVELYASATDAFENAVLLHYFNNSAHANVGDATGVRGSSTAGVFYISLHTADPGETGDQSTNETAYTNYVRVSVARSSAGFTVSGSSVSNTATVTFAQCGASGATLTHFGIGSDVSGAGNLFFSGALTSSLIVNNGVTPSFAIGSLTCSAA